MLNRLPLRMQVGQRIPPNILRLQRNALTVPQPLRAAIQAVRTREQLLPLLELLVGVRVVGVAVPEQRLAVVGEGFEFAFAGVDVGLEIAEALADFAADGGGDVLFFDAHLVQLSFREVKVSKLLSVDGNLLLDQGPRLWERTSSFASSRARSACRTAALRGSPDSSGI